MKTLMPVVIASVLAREKYTQLFRQLDENKDDALDVSELADTGLSEESVAHLDVNDDGTISLDEFLALARS